MARNAATGQNDHIMETRPEAASYDRDDRYLLIGVDGHVQRSVLPGTLGGHRRSRIYGRLDCPVARRALARGGYREHRVFFADATDARSAGYRPCAVCLPKAYRLWRAA